MEKSLYIECVDCHIDFEFTVGEQQFYEARDFQPPRRCKDCRNRKKADQLWREKEREQ